MAATIITLGTQKGGTAKTSSTISIAYALSQKPFNKRVLCVDLDPQGSLSMTLGMVDPAQQPSTVADLFDNNDTMSWAQVITRSKYENIDLIPANIDLFDACMSIGSGNPMGVMALQSKLDKATLEQYDYILIDLAPNLGGPNVVNAMVVSDYFVIPVESASIYSMKGLEQFMKAINSVKCCSSHKLEVLGLLITKFNGRTTAAKVVEDMLVKRYGNLVFNTRIAQSTLMEQAGLMNVAVQSINSKCVPARNYRALTYEILERIGDPIINEIEKPEDAAPEEMDREAESKAEPKRRAPRAARKKASE